MNPFRDSIVADPWEAAQTDVSEIHADVFRRCLDGVEYVREARRSAGLLVHGEAGSGKTHLLSRLRACLTTTTPAATDRNESLFVCVRLQTSPRSIWRHLRRCFVDDWLRPVPNGKREFDRVLFHRLSEVWPDEELRERWFEYTLEENPKELDRLLDLIADQSELDHNMAVALKHLVFERHPRELRAWLRGDSLAESALERLELPTDDGSDEDCEQQARDVVLMLCRLAGPRLPIVLSFDQVEALQVTPTDYDGILAFGQFITALHDETRNLLLVSCILSAIATQLKGHVHDANYDRMTSLGTITLEALDRRQAERLIGARRESATAGLPSVPPFSPCWPLEADELKKLVEPGNLTPRRLLSRCAAEFDNRLAAKPTRITLPPTAMSEAQFLDDAWAERVEQSLAANQPEKTEEIVLHGLPLLVNLGMPGWVCETDRQIPDVTLVFVGHSQRIGFSLCTQANMNSLASRFRRLKNQFSPGRLTRLVVVRDSRSPISPTAKKAKQYLDELRATGAVVRHPSIEALATLDALRRLLSDAKSGDLAFEGDTVSPRTIEEWLRAHLSQSLCEWIDDLGVIPSSHESSGGSDFVELEELSALLVEKHLMAVDAAAERLRQSAATVAATVQRHPNRFGLLVGPPAVLFQITNE